MKTNAIVSTITVIVSLLVSNGVYAAGSALDYLKAGQKAVGQQQFDVAVKHLSKALGSTDLSSEETAQALYFRGVAYNGKGEPARSIADLTRAIFFKKIPLELKANILKARAKAYRAVGLGSRADADLRSAGVGGTQIASVRRPPASSFQTRSQPEPARRQAPRPEPRRNDSVTSGWGANVSANPKQQDRVQPVRQAAVQRQPSRATIDTPKSQDRQKSLRSMFETNDKSQPGQTVAKKNTHRAGLTASDWNANRPQAKPKRIAHTERVASYQRPTTSASGRYRLQLAAVSSENAQNAWAQLVSKHNSLLSGQNPDFQTVNLGNSKSVVRIQIGPFADKLQTLQLCNTFKQEGLDCFLVVR